MKAPLELVENRVKYYEKVIRAILKAVGVSTEKLEFVLGSVCQWCQTENGNQKRALTKI